ncbi:ABC transporter permease [Bailinhaonella thermotolerans]|uniref:ABC transporter permease n=1 Tax=Bailinhaonella thermotolerans TaxID=1070861 RepID=A0A3A4A496_9ACTN|nr:ABC transporter permease [Bailinhaonella thermotolerans]RJL21736.1 ABC transporter permease [Bailinhaonella thermotolerans]
MTAPAIDRPAPASAPVSPARPGRRRLGDRLLTAYGWIVIAWLLLPIAVMVLFGFNDTRSRTNFTWEGFTLQWYGRLFEIPGLSAGFVNSLVIAVLTAVIATALGMMIGLALGRYRFRGQGLTNLIMFAAISCPEIIMGTSLLSMFLMTGIPLGRVTLVIAHVMFSVSFVAVTVRARVLTLDRSLEEAAQDLGASRWETFRLVTFPSILPAVTAGALLAFALSVDDFIISTFVNGPVETFPLWVWSASRLGIPPQVNVMGTLIFAVGAALAVVNAVGARRRG